MLGAQRIIKRTGEVVPFDGGRIRNAILKAVRATKSAVDEAAVDELVEPIQREIQLRFVERSIVIGIDLIENRFRQ